MDFSKKFLSIGDLNWYFSSGSVKKKIQRQEEIKECFNGTTIKKSNEFSFLTGNLDKFLLACKNIDDIGIEIIYHLCLMPSSTHVQPLCLSTLEIWCGSGVYEEGGRVEKGGDEKRAWWKKKKVMEKIDPPGKSSKSTMKDTCPK